MTVWYRQGTASVSNGSRAVTGTLTGWLNQVKPGDGITFDDGGTWHEVASVESNTGLTLANDYAGETVSMTAYAIDRRSPQWSLASDLAVKVASLLGSITTLILTSGKPNDGIGNDGAIAFDVDAQMFYFKSDGQWNDGTSLRGDLVGPGATVVAGEIAVFSDTTGEEIEGAGVTIGTLAAAIDEKMDAITEALVLPVIDDEPATPAPGSKLLYAFSDGKNYTKDSAGDVVEVGAGASSGVVYNVKKYGAAGDGVTDDTASIQAAIDAVTANAYGGTVYFPSGIYQVSATLIVNHHHVTLQGDGNNNSTLRRVAGWNTGYTVDFSRGGGTNAIYWGGIKDLRFIATEAMTSHGHIRLNVARLFEISNLYIEDGFIGIHAVSVADTNIANSTIVTGKKYPTSSEAFAYIFFGTDPAAAIPRNGAYLENLNLRSKDDDGGHCLYGIYVSSADGIWADSVHIGNCNNSCLSIIPADGTTQLSGLKFDNCWFDQGGTGRGINCAGSTTAAFGYMSFTDCFFTGGSMSNAVRFAASSIVKHVFFDACLIIHFTSSGMTFSNVNDFAVRGCTLRDIGTGGGSVHGIHVTSGCSNYLISNNQVGYNASLSGNALTGYGIVLTGSGFICEGNDCRGNATGGILDSGTGERVVRSNLGASGSGTIASAATITLPADGELFTITGATSITSVVASWRGRRVTFVSSGALTFTDGSNLKLAGNYSMSADDTITLVCDGANWYEVARSGDI